MEITHFIQQHRKYRMIGLQDPPLTKPFLWQIKSHVESSMHRSWQLSSGDSKQVTTPAISAQILKNYSHGVPCPF